MPAHRFRTQPLGGLAGRTLTIEGDEARHGVRVKRLRVGEEVELLDGMGCVAGARVESVNPREPSVVVAVVRVEEVSPERPRLHVMTSVPVGAHAEEMIAGLSQVGAASWQPLACARSEATGRSLRLERLQRIAAESSKQCGRAWDLEIGIEVSLEEALRHAHVVVADRSGRWYEPIGADEITLLIGPEGGWNEDEISAARDAGAAIASFGRHVMRIETAAVAAASVIMHKGGVR